ncbi:L-threonylcarbamoyladenylate synthase [Micromonospora sp. NPDC050397]|uniref:L-threonylcarbamoyladenylate synthase n=1 Tax=Micromonospora sp. NPDC050397 TaxID=3364279 RepID=UPI00384E6B7C
MLYDCRSLAERDRGIAAAIEAVKNGELIVLPTDTVYGVGADAFTPYAVTAMLNAKGRGRNVPSPVLVGSRHTLDGLVFTLPQSARDLVAAFWPGALTIIVEHSPSLQWDLGDTSGTVAVRMPLHPVAIEVLRETGPMAVSSANKHGQPAAVTAEEARDQLGYAVRAYLEAGPCPDPVPSTIVDLTGEAPRVVRQGAIPLEKLRDVVPDLQAQGA